MVAAAVAHTDEIPPDNLVLRSFDPAEINAILNDPAVFKYAAAQGFQKLDVTPLIADERNVLLMADGGGVLCIWCDQNTYEVHTNFLKPDRAKQSQSGPYIRNVCLAAYRWMFTRTDCMTLLTRIPHHNRAALIFSPLVGWVPEFERKAVWPAIDGEMVDMSFCSLRYDDWVRKTPDLMRIGRAFHARLSDEFRRHGALEEQHADEDCHDLHVGACAEMISGGQIDKAVALYNRWARFAGFGEMAIVARNPAVIDIGNALLQIVGETFKVILVR